MVIGTFNKWNGKNVSREQLLANRSVLGGKLLREGQKVAQDLVQMMSAKQKVMWKYVVK